MATLYILHSKMINKYYIGSCKDFDKRMLQHITKEFDRSFTKQAMDWALYYKIDDLHYTQARNIESHIKRMKSKIYIQNLKQYPELSKKLIQMYK